MPHFPKIRSLDKGWLRLIGFLLLLLVPLAIGEVYVRSLPNAARDKHVFLTAHADEVDILVLGSSHTYYGIAPQLLSPVAYSAAQVSQTLRYDAWVLEHYNFGQKLQWGILPISDFTFYEELEGSNEWYLASRYRLYIDCNLHSPLSVYGWEVTAFPVFLEKLKSLWQPPRMYWSRYGQGLEYTQRAKSPHWDNGEQRVRQNCYTDYRNAPANEKFLAKIADHCHRLGARLLLISTPLRPSYRAAQDPRQVNDMEERLHRFLQTHPQVLWWDFRSDPQFTANDFYDADHLSIQGAHLLTREISRRIGHLQTGRK